MTCQTFLSVRPTAASSSALAWSKSFLAWKGTGGPCPETFAGFSRWPCGASQPERHWLFGALSSRWPNATSAPGILWMVKAASPGQASAAADSVRLRALPIGFAHGVKLRNPVKTGAPVTREDVELSGVGVAQEMRRKTEQLIM
jgi:hypothetical protein